MVVLWDLLRHSTAEHTAWLPLRFTACRHLSFHVIAQDDARVSLRQRYFNAVDRATAEGRDESFGDSRESFDGPGRSDSEEGCLVSGSVSVLISAVAVTPFETTGVFSCSYKDAAAVE